MVLLSTKFQLNRMKTIKSCPEKKKTLKMDGGMNRWMAELKTNEWMAAYNRLILQTLINQRDIYKQCKSRSDCFFRSSLIRVFPVCYSDQHLLILTLIANSLRPTQYSDFSFYAYEYWFSNKIFEQKSKC